MNITHIIGNGFDINQGIPTSYAHFYEYYLQLVPEANESEVIRKFRIQLYNDLLEDRTELWSDMELALGKVTKNYSSASEFETVYMDVYKHLMEYIDYAYRYSEVAQFENPVQTLFQDLAMPWRHLTKSDSEEIENLFRRESDNHVRILSFNYTDTFGRITDIDLKNNMVLGMGAYTTYRFNGLSHIHHTINSKDIIVGVDNINQIANSDFANEESIRNILVKPQTNIGLGTLVDRESREIIGQSGIISLYGVSLGDTDKSWWLEIGKRLKESPNVRILYFPFVKEINEIAEIQKPTLRAKKKRELLKALGIDKNAYKNFESRIFVNICNNPGSRNIFSNPKKRNLNDNFENVMAMFQKEGKVAVPKPQPKTPLGIDSSLLNPIRLFEPRYYKAKSILTEISNPPFGDVKS